MFPTDKQAIIENELVDCFMPKDGSALAVGLIVGIMDRVEERREMLFPDLRKIIVVCEAEIVGDRFTLNVTSAPVPPLG